MAPLGPGAWTRRRAQVKVVSRDANISTSGGGAFLRVLTAAGEAALVNCLLADVADTVSPLVTSFDKGAGIGKFSGNRLDDLEDLHRIIHCFNLRFPNLQNRQGDAEEGFRSLAAKSG